MSVPEADDDDLLARFAVPPPVVAKVDAWEVLDPMLNSVAGQDVSVQKVVGLIRRGAKGMDGLLEYVEHFVVEHEIPGALLEGKFMVLTRAMEFL